MLDTITHNGIWYEVEITECYQGSTTTLHGTKLNTYVILRDRWGFEFKFINDDKGWNGFFLGRQPR